ncbi:MAG: hypothetical protein HY769_07265 [Candidatus Stahlbacteria bacterium]|nr:hypothetical protein [Candidatus Stahlbacteria bacterium]
MKEERGEMKVQGFKGSRVQRENLNTLPPPMKSGSCIRGKRHEGTKKHKS